MKSQQNSFINTLCQAWNIVCCLFENNSEHLLTINANDHCNIYEANFAMLRRAYKDRLLFQTADLSQEREISLSRLSRCPFGCWNF